MTELEGIYRRLSPFMSIHFLGTPSADDLRQLLRDAYHHRAGLQAAIAEAEKILLPETVQSRPRPDGYCLSLNSGELD